MSKKGNASKHALEELFSNSTNEIGVESKNKISNDKREELKKSFFGIFENKTPFENGEKGEFRDAARPIDNSNSASVSAFDVTQNHARQTASRQASTFSEVSQYTGTVPKVAQHTGTMPKAPQHTGTVPKVAQHTGTMSKVPQHMGTVPKVTQHTGTMPKVPQHTGTMPKVPQEASKAVEKAPVQKKKRSKIVRWIISAFVFLFVTVCVVTAVFLIKERDKYIPADLVCGIGSTSAPSAELRAKESTLSPTSERFKVTFTFYEEPEIICTTSATTVGDLLCLLGIELDGTKRMSYNETDEVTGDCTVDIKTLSYKNAETTEAIPFETEYIDVQTIPKGTTSVYRAGINGVKTYTYKCLLVNGEEESRELIGESVTSSPTTQLLYRGIGGTITSQGQTYSFSYYIDVSATTYHIVGTTASGLPTSESVMAVDPRVIPLGTACVVKGSYGDFGYRIAADTGGSIKGNKIDIWLPENSYYADGFGWRAMRVYILN